MVSTALDYALRIVFPLEGEDEDLVLIPLTFPMEWKNSPPMFCMATETLANLANTALCLNIPALPHSMNDMAETIFRGELTTLHPVMSGLTRDPYLSQANTKRASVIDVFVDNLLGLSQEPAHWWLLVCRILFYALDKVFRPRESGKLAKLKELLSLKNPRKGDCAWSTCQVLLG